MRRLSSGFLIGIATVVWATPVLAQTNEEAFEQFQWQMSAPGARTLAMGGGPAVTTGSPTAIVLNPAALAKASRPEVSVEFRNTDLRVGRLAAVDALFTETPTVYRDTMSALSFVGVMLPISAGRIVVAAARHEFLDYRSSFHIGPRTLPGVTGAARGYSPVDSDIDLRGVGYAAGLAATVSRNLSVGFTLSADQLRAHMLNSRYDIAAGATAFALTETTLVTNRSVIDDEGEGIGIVVSANYEPLSSFSIAMVYTRRPAFTVAEEVQLNVGRSRGANGPFSSQTGFPAAVTIDAPDQFGAGITWTVQPRLALVGDVEYVRYSELGRAVRPVIAHDLVSPADFRVADGVELRAGGECNVGGERRPVFVRAGFASIPNHRLEFVGNVQPGPSISAAQAERANAIERAVFNLGPDDGDVRATMGGGFTVGPFGTVDIAYVWKRQFVVALGGRF